MKIEDIIEALNMHLEDIRKSQNVNTYSKFILLKQIIPDPKFSIYKTYKYVLYYVEGKNNYPTIRLEESMRVPKDMQDKFIERFNIMFVRYLFNWITNSEDYNKIIKGEYKK